MKHALHRNSVSIPFLNRKPHNAAFAQHILMLMTDDCGLLLLLIPSFSSSSMSRDPLVFIWCLCFWEEPMFCWYLSVACFYSLYRALQRGGSECMYSYFTSVLSHSALHMLSWWEWMRRAGCEVLSGLCAAWLWTALMLWGRMKPVVGGCRAFCCTGLCSPMRFPEADPHLCRWRKFSLSECLKPAHPLQRPFICGWFSSVFTSWIFLLTLWVSTWETGDVPAPQDKPKAVNSVSVLMLHFYTDTLRASFNSLGSLKAFHFQNGLLVGFSFYCVILSIGYNSSHQVNAR